MLWGTPGGGASRALGYTLAPFEPRVRALSSAHIPGTDARAPHRILLRTLRHALHVRVRGTAGPPAQGPQGRFARVAQLRHVRRHVDGRSDGRGSQRCRSRADVAAARGIPQDLQLLHGLPPVHVRQLLERGRGSLPVLRAAVRSRAGHDLRQRRCRRRRHGQRVRGDRAPGAERARWAGRTRADGLADVRSHASGRSRRRTTAARDR